jgi:dolichyl-phosphate beta-glucosyltransferase
LFSDADLSTPIEELERMWAWYEQGHDLVIASRSMADSRILVRQSWYRRGIGRAFNQLVGVLAVRGFKDTQCGFKLFAASAAKKIFAGLRTRGFAFDVEVLMRARRYGFRIAEVPVRWVNDAASKVHPVRDSVRMLVEILRLRGLL